FHLCVQANHNPAATRVRQGYDLLRDLFRVGQFYFEFEKSVFTAANQPQQFGSGCLRCWRGEDVFLKGTLRGGFVTLIAAKSSASHLCIDGAQTRPDAYASLDSSIKSECSTTIRRLALAPLRGRRFR